MTDPRKADTLDEAARNPDGTYDGAKALVWMNSILHPGSKITEEDVRAMWEKVKRDRKK